MHVRVVRFTDADPVRMDQLMKDVSDRGGPPQDVPATGLQILQDSDQKTAVVLQFFDSEADMKKAEQFFDSMDPGETPGQRASVDRCELKLDLHA